MASEHPLKYFMSTRLFADEACQLTLSPVAGTRHLKAWAVPRDSPYAGILNYWYRSTYRISDIHIFKYRDCTDPDIMYPQNYSFHTWDIVNI
jgi:hypothetical protein